MTETLTQKQQDVLSCLPPAPHGALVQDIAVDVLGVNTTAARSQIRTVFRQLRRQIEIHVEHRRDAQAGERLRYAVSEESWPVVLELMKDWNPEGTVL